MKKVIVLVVMMLMVLGFSMQAEATLQNLGVDSAGNRLIYDTDRNITWYDYTNTYLNNTWQNQVDWADGLSVTFGSNTYTDWRLPTALNQDGSGPCNDYNCTNSELGHLWYTELGNEAYAGVGSDLSNTGDFQYLTSGYYWLGTEYAPNTTGAWYFNTYNGRQSVVNKDFNNYAIAVRPGLAVTTVVPEPISSMLFIIGGATLGFRRFRKKINT